MPKEGGRYDLPIAICCCASSAELVVRMGTSSAPIKPASCC
ncbi:hypothetical protein ACUOFC_43845 [Escherichia sp. TWPC-MK]